jgi:hypothetical protein
MVNWEPIKKKVNEHGYMSGTDRMSDRVKETGEVFTPTDTVIEMIEYMGADKYSQGKTVLDPACGDGQLLVTVKWLKVLHFGMSEQDALNDIYGVDIMCDNVDLCKKRLGGGTIIMGDTLRPEIRLDEQTEEEHYEMYEYFYKGSKRYFKHIKKRKDMINYSVEFYNKICDVIKKDIKKRKDMINKARLYYKETIAKKQKYVVTTIEDFFK